MDWVNGALKWGGEWRAESEVWEWWRLVLSCGPLLVVHSLLGFSAGTPFAHHSTSPNQFGDLLLRQTIVCRCEFRIRVRVRARVRGRVRVRYLAPRSGRHRALPACLALG